MQPPIVTAESLNDDVIAFVTTRAMRIILTVL